MSEMQEGSSILTKNWIAKASKLSLLLNKEDKEQKQEFIK
jgi:hypothetical protein